MKINFVDSENVPIIASYSASQWMIDQVGNPRDTAAPNSW